MRYVVAVSACGSHDRCIRDWRAVVAVYSACHASSDDRCRKLWMRLCDGKSEWDQDTECTPGCTRCECQYASDQEECSRDKSYSSSAHVLYELAYEVSKTKAVCHCLECPSQCQYEYWGSHSLHSLRNAAHDVLEVYCTSHHVVNDDDEESCKASHRKSDRSVRIRESFNEV